MFGDRYVLVSEDGDRVELKQGTTIVGRSPNCDLKVEHVEVSRQHARLIVNDDGLVVEDLDSANGTLVDGMRVEGMQELDTGNRIRFGPVGYTVEVDIEQDKTSIYVPPQTPEPEVEEEVEEAIADAQPPAEVEQEAEPEAVAEEEDSGLEGSIEVLPVDKEFRELQIYPGWDSKEQSTQYVKTAELEIPPQLNDDDITKLEEKVDAPTLMIMSGDKSGTPYKLRSTGSLSFWTIGKSAEQNMSIVLDDDSVSDHHATLICDNGKWQLKDQMARNHTYVNGDRYNAVFLTSRDILQFGRVSALFLLPPGAGPAPEQPSGGVFKKIKSIFGS